MLAGFGRSPQLRKPLICVDLLERVVSLCERALTATYGTADLAEEWHAFDDSEQNHGIRLGLAVDHPDATVFELFPGRMDSFLVRSASRPPSVSRDECHAGRTLLRQHGCTPSQSFGKLFILL